MDYGREYADMMLNKMVQQITKALNQSNKEAEQKIKSYLAKYQSLIDDLTEQVERGEITEQEFQQILISKLTTGKEWAKVRDEVAEDMSNAQENAIQATAVLLTAVYLYNRNYSNHQIERTLKVKVKKVVNLPRHKTHEPITPVKLNRAKNHRWHKRKVESVVRQGMKKGHSVDRMAKELRKVTGMDKNSSIRTVRTSVTNAESMARMDSFFDAEAMGISMEKEWSAVKDSRTRTSHRVVDGERIPLRGYFSNGLYRPGDPYGDPREIYNCRCKLKGVPEGYEILDEPKAPAGMGRYEWIGEKPIPKHYNESKKDYNKRVRKYREKSK